MPVSLPSVSEIFPGYVTGVSKEKFDEVPEIQDNLDKKIKETIDYINRGDVRTVYIISLCKIELKLLN